MGTFHTYSENALTNGIAAVPLGGRRRMNRLHVRIAVSEAAAWTARRFYGGRYRIIPNGVHLHPLEDGRAEPGDGSSELRRGNADTRFDVARTRRGTRPARASCGSCSSARPSSARACRSCCAAFEALRDHVPATLTLVGGERRGGRPHDARRPRRAGARQGLRASASCAELARADVLCAPSLHGESFGMVLTEAFAAATPGDRLGHPRLPRRAARRPATGCSCAARRRARAGRGAARRSRSSRPSAQRMARSRDASAPSASPGPTWPPKVLDCYEQAIGPPASPRGRRARPRRRALRPRARPTCCPGSPPQRLPSLQPARPSASPARLGAPCATLRRVALLGSSLAGVGARARWRCSGSGVARVAASLVASKPGLLAAGLALMCAAMFVRALAWHAILARRPDLAAGQTPRRDAGHVHRRADVRHAARPPRRALAGADRRPPPGARARDAARGARHDGLPDAAEPARADDARRRHAVPSVSVLDGHDRGLLLARARAAGRAAASCCSRRC